MPFNPPVLILITNLIPIKPSRTFGLATDNRIDSVTKFSVDYLAYGAEEPSHNPGTNVNDRLARTS